MQFYEGFYHIFFFTGFKYEERMCLFFTSVAKPPLSSPRLKKVFLTMFNFLSRISTGNRDASAAICAMRHYYWFP